MNYPFGIDISRWQYGTDITTQKPDFKIIRSKATFIGIRAGMSWGYTDPTFRNSWMETEGMYRIAYHVVYAGEDPIRQMKHFLSIVKPGPKDLLALDLEVDHGYSKARYTDTVVKCIDYLRQETGRLPIIYSRALWINLHIDVSKLPADIPWWLAYYRKTNPTGFTPEADPPPLLPKGVKTWLIHQTGDKTSGAVVGVKSYTVDTNRFNGTIEDLACFFGAAEIPEPPEPKPPVVEKPLYKATVKDIAPDRLNVRNAPNGTIIDKIYAGDEVEVWQEQSGWSRIGVGRWVSEQYLQRYVDGGRVAEGLLSMPLWNQRDPRWGWLKMGNSGITLAEEGCLVSVTSGCLSVILGREVTPLEYGTLLNSGPSGSYGYLNPTNRMYWQIPVKKYGVPLEIFKVFPSGYGWEDTVRTMLRKGLPAMGRVDMLPGAGYLQHWVTFLGEIEGIFWIHDPWYGIVSALKARYPHVFHISAYGRPS